MSSLPTAPDLAGRAALGMLASALLCYGAAALGLMGWPLVVLFAAFLGCGLLSLAALCDGRVAIVVSIVAVLVVISLGSPGEDWDPRSIWLFHAKRIYLEGTLYAQLDDYAPWSHNDYPVLVPLLMASAAKLVGQWNELFPKAIAPLLLLPALLLIGSSLRSRQWLALFVLGLLLMGGEMLVNGYLDVAVAVYAVAALATAMRLREARVAPRGVDLLAFALVIAVLSLLKNEGVVVAGVVVGFVLFEALVRERRLYWKVALAFVVAVLPLLAWMFAVSSAGVGNDLATTDMKAQAWARLSEQGGSALILKRLLVPEWVLLPLLVMAVMWRRSVRQPTVVVAILAALAYGVVLYLVYLGTPHDLNWHLRTSVSRTLMPVMLLLVYALVVLMDRRTAQNRSGSVA